MAKAKTPKKRAQAPPSKRRLTPAEYDAAVKTRLDSFGPELYELYVAQRDSKADMIRQYPLYYWRLGKDVHRINKQYKDKAVQVFAAALDVAATDVQSALRLTQVYPQAKQLNEVLALRTPRGKPIMWSQLRRLISDDIADAERPALIRKCLDEEWTTDELAAQLKARLGERPGHGGGRPISEPKSLGHGLAKWSSLNAVWIKFGRQVFGAEDGIAKMLEQTPAERITPAMLEQIGEVEAQLEAVVEVAGAELGSVKTVRAHVQSVLAGRPDEGDAAASSDAEDEAPAPGTPAPGGAAARAAGLPAKKRRHA